MSPSGGLRNPPGGRPRRTATTSDTTITIRCTAAERAAWAAKAARKDKSISTWLRDLAQRAK